MNKSIKFFIPPGTQILKHVIKDQAKIPHLFLKVSHSILTSNLLRPYRITGMPALLTSVLLLPNSSLKKDSLRSLMSGCISSSLTRKQWRNELIFFFFFCYWGDAKFSSTALVKICKVWLLKNTKLSCSGLSFTNIQVRFDLYSSNSQQILSHDA